MRALDRLLYAVFPRRCDICGTVILPSVGRCDDCLSAPRIEGKLCDHCGKSVDRCDCKPGTYRDPRYKAVYAPFYYQDNIAVAVRRMKLSGYSELTVGMGREMAHCISQHCGDVHFDFVTYVPISARRERARGYNQARLLADAVASELDLPVVDALQKIANTSSQRMLSGHERRGNVFGVFDLVPGTDVDGKTILLIDDVRTTGATLSECADMLRIYGATTVYASTFAIR